MGLSRRCRYLFDLWTFEASPWPGSATQQSVFRLRLLLKTGVQLAIESTLRKQKAKRKAKLKIAKKKIALAVAFVTALFEIPRAIAGPVGDMWNAHAAPVACWRPSLVIKWGEMTLRLLDAAASISDEIEEALEVC